jgi:O-antigen/teichoic acid export membrane protein
MSYLDVNVLASLATVLAIGVLINALAHIPQALIQARGFPKWTAWLHVAELSVYVLYAPMLIETYGLFGAALTWLIRASLSAIALYWIAARFLRSAI